MNIFNKIALQGLKKNRTRTIVTIAGAVLSSLMITGVATFGVSLLDYMARGAVQKYGGWNAAFLDADPSFVRERTQDQDIADSAVFENIGYATLDEGANPGKPYLFIAGFEEETFDALPTTLIWGRLPANDSEVLVSARLLTDGGVSYHVGDKISVSVGSREKDGLELTQASPYNSEGETFIPRQEKTYTVVGACRTPVFEPDDAPGYTLITKSSGVSDSPSQSLFITLKSPRKVYSYVEQMKDGRAYILNYDVLRVMGISDQAADNIFMGFLYSFGGIVLGIIMVGSIFLIYNSFSISLNERIREIGVLASVGATARQLRNSVLFEGFCIGLIGVPIGILAGLGGIKIVLSAVSSRFASILYDGVSLTAKISVPVICGAALVSLVTILISAWLPAKKAVRRPVMECIRQTNEIQAEQKAMNVSRFRQRIYGLPGILARKNFNRNRKRYRSIILSLVLSIVLFVCANALIRSMRQTAEDFRIVSDFDIGFSAQHMEDGDLLRLYDKLKNVSYVQNSSCRLAVRYTCQVPADQLSDAYWDVAPERSSEEFTDIPMEVHFFDDEFYRNMAEKLGLSLETHTGEPGTLIAVAKIDSDDDEVNGVSDLADVLKSASLNASLTPCLTDPAAAAPEVDVSVTVAEFVPPDIPPLLAPNQEEPLPYTFQILAPWSEKDRLAPSSLPIDEIVRGLCFDSDNPSQSVREMQQIIENERLSSAYLLINCSEAYEQYQNYIFIANIFAYVFIALISLIAAANVFNTISTNIRLRRRELAMLRSVGMSDKDFNRMMRFECAFYGTKALAVGIPLSLILSVLIVKLTTTRDTAFSLPWLSIGISTFSVFLIIFVTMMYAVRKIKKENIIDALRDEMT